MRVRALSLAALACLFAAACGERGQQLPFDTPTADPVVKTVPDAGGTISTAAGASVQLPAGAVAGGTTVTLAPVAAQSSASGTAAAQNAFKLEPAGLALTRAADVDLTLNRAQAAWMASVVVSTPSGVIEDGEGSVDLATGLLRGSISTLGTVSALIPEPAAVLRAGPLSSATAALLPAETTPRAAVAVPTRSLRGDCGAPGRRCDGLVVEVSSSLLDLVDSAVVIYPKMQGELRISGASATGSLTLVAPLRVRLSSQANATTVPSRITATATAATTVTETAGRIVLNNVTVVGESGSSRGQTTANLVIDYAGTRAFIRLSHSFQATVSGGARENVTVAARIPLLRVE